MSRNTGGNKGRRFGSACRRGGAAGVELVVLALLFHELLMGAPLYYPPLLHDHDAVGVAHGGEPVGDDEGGAPGHKGVHALLHQLLGTGVYGGGGLVQYQGGRIGHGGPGYGQQLPLALAQVGPVTGEHSVVAVGQAAYEAVCIGQLCRGDALLVGGVQTAVAPM